MNTSLALETLHRRIRISGVLLLIGLLIETISLIWFTPLTFTLFGMVGLTFVGAGILLYLWSLV